MLQRYKNRTPLLSLQAPDACFAPVGTSALGPVSLTDPCQIFIRAKVSFPPEARSSSLAARCSLFPSARQLRVRTAASPVATAMVARVTRV